AFARTRFGPLRCGTRSPPSCGRSRRRGVWALRMLSVVLKRSAVASSLAGEAMRRDPITFRPTHTVVMTTSEDPFLTDRAPGELDQTLGRNLPCTPDCRDHGQAHSQDDAR